MPKPSLVTLTLSKIVPAYDFNKHNEALDKLVWDLANKGWILSVEEVLTPSKRGSIQLGEE